MALVSFFSCKKDINFSNNSVTPLTDIQQLNVVTGINTVDEQGVSSTSLGYANEFGQASAYPNPSSGKLTIRSASPDVAFAQVYVYKANVSKNFSNSSIAAAFDNFRGYSNLELESNYTKKVLMPDAPSIAKLDLTGLNEGYYKIVLKTANGSQIVKNIKIDKTSSFSQRENNAKSDWN